jgi:hypothetical protein
MRAALIAAAVTCAGLFAVGAGAAENGPILPGYWESTSTASFPAASSKTERKCITGRAINSYLTGPSNNHYTCRYDTRDLHDGHAQMAGECVDSSGIRGKITIQGTYAPDAFRLNGRLLVSLGGLQIPVNTSIDAHRLSAECPAGAKVEDGGKGPAGTDEVPAPSDSPQAQTPKDEGPG